MQHSIVAATPGRFKAWPANGGLWAWGDEVLAMYYDGTEDFADPLGHAVAMQEHLWVEQARSRDGGATWTIERDPLPYPTEANVSTLPRALDFGDPNLVLCFKMLHWEYGISFLYYSENRGHDWQGPFHFPTFGRETVNARNCYLTHNSHECVAWLSGGFREVRSEDGYEAFVIRSRDGGLTWEEIGRPCRATPPLGNGQRNFTIMPSALQLTDGSLLCLTRCLDTTTVPGHWIEAWHSDDGGVTWRFRSRVETDGKSSPPAATRLADGNVALTYGYRAAPFGVRARVSSDAGRTWSAETILRDDGGNWDIGYTRNVLLADGDLLTVYYFNTHAGGDRRIESTRWRP